MPIKNQIDHRADYAKQKAAGQITDVTAGRHGRNRPHLAARLARARQRSVQRPLAAEGKSLAEQLGIPVPEGVKRRVAQAAKPPETLTPTPTPNEPEMATPEVVIDPPQAEGELPPVAKLRELSAINPPTPQRSWFDDERTEEDDKPGAEAEPGGCETPLV